MNLERLKPIGSGLYVRKSTGELYLFVREFLEEEGYFDTPANREAVAAAAKNLAAKRYPGVPIKEG